MPSDASYSEPPPDILAFPFGPLLIVAGCAMPMPVEHVPIYVEVTPSEVLKGILRIEGALSLDAHVLSLAYKLYDVRSTPFDTGTVHIPADALRDAEMKGAKLLFHPRHLSTLSEMPWVSADAVVLRVKRTHRKKAAALMRRLQALISEADEETPRSIPFQLPSMNLGITEAKGLLYLDDEFLVFEVGTGISGGYKKKRQIIKIEPRALEAIRIDRGTLRDQIAVTPKHRDLMQAMPGMYKDKDEITLTISKKYREDAEHLVHEIRRLKRQS